MCGTAQVSSRICFEHTHFKDTEVLGITVMETRILLVQSKQPSSGSSSCGEQGCRCSSEHPWQCMAPNLLLQVLECLHPHLLALPAPGPLRRVWPGSVSRGV